MKKRTQQRVVFTIGSLVALILTLYTVIALSVANTTLRAGAAATPESFFTFNSATGEITDYDIAGGTDVVIPSSIGGVAVTRINSPECSYEYVDGNYEEVCVGSFFGKGLTSVVIPEGVQTIDSVAFSENAITGTVIIPDSVSQIGYGAFSYNQIERVYIGSSITELRSSVFANNLITDLEGGEGLEVISSAAFYGNKFTSLGSLPASVKTISDAAFMNNDFIVLEIPDTVEYISGMAFSGPQLEEVVVGSAGYSGASSLTLDDGAFIRELDSDNYTDPGIKKVTINGVVKVITNAAFQYQPITTLIINEGVEEISRAAFADTSVSEVHFPNSLQSIERAAFERASLLHTVKIGTDDYSGPAQTVIIEGAFESSGQPGDINLDTVILNGSVKTVTNASFSGNAIKTLTINEGVEVIDEEAFAHTSIESLHLPNSLRSLSGSPFVNTATLKTVEIGTADYEGPAQTVIIEGAFESSGQPGGLNIDTVILNGSVKSVTEASFRGNAIKTLTINEGVEVIDEEAFAHTSIESLHLPNSLRSLSGGAFMDIATLRTIEIGTADYEGPAFLDIGAGTFEVLSYEDDTTFYDTSSDSSLTLNGSVRTIEPGAFAKLRVAHVYARSGLQEIAEGAFNGAYVHTAELPDSITSIANGAFAETSLREITIHGNPIIGEGVFSYTGLDVNTLPKSGDRDVYYQNNAELVQVYSDNDTFSYESEYFYGSYYDAGDGAQYRVVSGAIVNPSSYTVTYKSKNGVTLAPNETFTSNYGYTDYRIINILDSTYPSGPSLRFSDYLQKGSVVSPEVPPFDGYVSPGKTEVSLKNGINVINYVYDTATEGGDDGNVTHIPLIPNTGVVAIMIYKNPILVIALAVTLMATLLYVGIRLVRR